jgi:hypothetical protein
MSAEGAADAVVSDDGALAGIITYRMLWHLSRRGGAGGPERSRRELRR